MRVLAIDPGERVGWATGTVDSYREGTVGGQTVGLSPTGRLHGRLTVETHGISFLKDFAVAAHRAIVVEDRYDVVIYETWRLRAAMARQFAGNDMQPSQLIGMVRLCCWLNPRVTLVSQGPNVMRTAEKSLATHPSGEDIQRRLAKLPKSHDDAHDGSALLHLWHWFWERYV